MQKGTKRYEWSTMMWTENKHTYSSDTYGRSSQIMHKVKLNPLSRSLPPSPSPSSSPSLLLAFLCAFYLFSASLSLSLSYSDVNRGQVVSGFRISFVFQPCHAPLARRRVAERRLDLPVHTGRSKDESSSSCQESNVDMFNPR